MLDLRHVMDHLEEVQAGLRRRSAAAAETLSPIAELGKQRRELIVAVESKAAQRNHANEAMAKADKKSPAFAEKRDELKRLSGEIKDAEKALGEVEARIQAQLAVVPNVPDAGVPDGKGEEDNQVVRVLGREAELRLHAQAALGDRHGPRHPRLRARRQALGRRASPCSSARRRGSSARSSRSCSTCTPASTATPRCSRPSW